MIRFLCRKKNADLMLQNSEIVSDISLCDPVVVIFEKEHLSRVRGLSH